MSILSLTDVSLAFGHHPVLDGVDFQISTGDRVCLVGRNGTGKSSLLRVISGAADPDDGKVWRRQALRVSHLEQEVLPDTDNTVYETVASGLGNLGQLLADFHVATANAGSNRRDLAGLAELQRRIDAVNGWNMEQKIMSVCSRLSVPVDQNIRACSGGVRRRVMLAKALASEPDLLLLDEPTNHMDISAITWLEEFLSSYRGALLFISHDRALLRKLANRIVELDRGTLTTFNGDYDSYLQKKLALLEIETRSNKKFEQKLSEHEAWIRQGIMARRTRNEGRVRKLLDMRREKARQLQVQGSVKMSLGAVDRSGRRVVDLRHVSFHYGQNEVIQDFSTSILRGDRVGIIGPNGSGKSTLLKIILAELKPSQGEVVTGTKLRPVYFDQQRSQLDLDKSVRDNVCEDGDYVAVEGKPRHVVSYLRDFLFPRERIDTPVKALSGGERNRLLLAKIFTQPANMIVLDEPTNDLDVDTLELLEDLLLDYEGTLLLVSHDRAFLDNVVSSTLVFEGNGVVAEYIGGYEDWLRQRKSIAAPKAGVQERKETANEARGPRATLNKTKLSYREKTELEDLPGRIDQLEQEQGALQREVSEHGFYKQDKTAISATMQRMETIRLQLEQAYQRWELLDSI